MRKILLLFITLLLTYKTSACDDIDFRSEDLNIFMGKKSKFYDAYKQSKCVFEDALKPFTAEQRRVIASLIAKSYQEDKNKKTITK